jgi:beta-N-acetylhexosaminidase
VNCPLKCKKTIQTLWRIARDGRNTREPLRIHLKSMCGNMQQSKWILIAFVMVATIACSRPAPAMEAPQVAPTPRANIPALEVPPTERKVESIDSLIASMTLREKIGQLVMPWLLGDYTAFGTAEFDRISTWIDSLRLGGIIISIGSPLDATAKLNALQRRSPLPLLIAADLEWGSAMRLVGGTAFPMAMGIGATNRELDAYELGRVTALEARAAGIHMTFSPVADVNNNPDNPIINTRSFGEDPEATARLVAAYVRGANEHGLFTTAKHFPGHGDTQSDSHINMPVVSACWDRLDTVELVPFRAAIAAGVTAVMTAHIALPCIDGEEDPPPATLSPAVMTGILRDSLGFNGLVVTDALTMGAIIQKYGVGETVVKAFLAGSDLLLIPADPAEAIEAMANAVESGRIPTERLDLSVHKMLALKEQAGLFRQRTVPLDSIPAKIGLREYQEIADDIAARSITVVQEGPIENFRQKRGRTAVIMYAEETNLKIGNTLIRELRALGESVYPFRLYPASGPMSYDSARAVIANNPRVVFAAGVRFTAGRGHIQFPDSLASLIVETQHRRPTVLAALGSPYLLNQLTGFTGGYLLAWADFEATERATARALGGRAPITGRLPITLSEEYPRGFGIDFLHR